MPVQVVALVDTYIGGVDNKRDVDSPIYVGLVPKIARLEHNRIGYEKKKKQVYASEGGNGLASELVFSTVSNVRLIFLS